MHERPPAELVALLKRLGLADAAQVERMGRRVRRLARDLPRFESVWVDALCQARILTPFQAAEINAGRGSSLRLGPYVIEQRFIHPCYVACYRARDIESRAVVRLAIVENAGANGDELLGQLQSLAGHSSFSDANSPHPNPLPKGEGTSVSSSSIVSSSSLVSRTGSIASSSSIASRTASLSPLSSPLRFPLPSPLFSLGRDGDRLFVAEPWVEGRTAAEWMVHHGRVPSEVVLEIARAMAAQLAMLEKCGICHGDVSTSSLVLTDGGEARLLLPGLRGILRPEEGYAHGDLPPEAYDSLAPERVSAGTPPNTASDIYACGCVWWQLLCGRPPLVGGDSLAKLRAAQAGEIRDVRNYAPDVSPPLAAAIFACLQRDPHCRPESMARLSAMLGSTTRGGREALADCLARTGRPTVHWTTTVRSIRRSNRTPFWIAGTLCCLTVALAICWQMSSQRSAISGQQSEQVASGQKLVASGQWPVASGTNLPSPASGRGAGGEGSGQFQNVASESNSKSRNPEIPKSQISNPSAEVVPASYQQVESKPEDLVLTADKAVEAESLKLQAGQCVRGPEGRRATILVPLTGMIVDKENVRFENIDFRARAMANNNVKSSESAMLELRAGRASFRGCSFQVEETERTPKAAVRWTHPSAAETAETSLPNGRIQWYDCFLHRVSIGLDCRTAGALSIELRNVLHLDAGSLVRLDHCPQSDEPVSIALEQLTLRNCGPLLECLAPRLESQPGEIAVTATACALVPEAEMPLIHVRGPQMPERLPAAIRWSGQGSLLGPRTPVIVWSNAEGQRRILDESALSIAGLVRSEVAFAGKPSEDPAASRLVRWQAPLQSADPPGYDPGDVPRR